MKHKLIFALSLLSLAFAFHPLQVKAVSPEELGLKEGDLISSFVYDKDPDIFIINEQGFKRLFLNQVIFKFYGHLRYLSVKLVKPEVKDQFTTSSFYRDCEDNDPKVYGLETTGEDTGVLHHVDVNGNTAASQDRDFFKKVFCINNREFKWYQRGSAYSSLKQLPYYRRETSITVSNLVLDPSSATIAAGETVNVKAIFTPSRPACADKTAPCMMLAQTPYEVNASLTSDNPSVAAVDYMTKDPCAPPRMCPVSVNKTVLVRGVSAGEAVITASYVDSQETYTAQMKVTVAVLSAATNECAKEPASSQNSCWQKMAEQKGDISFCGNITVPNAFFSHDSCVNAVAQAKKDSSLCASIVDSSIKQGCVSSITSGQLFPWPLPHASSTP